MAITIVTSDKIVSGGRWTNSATSVKQSVSIATGDPVMPPIDLGYTNGTGTAQCDLWYCKRRTLAANTTESLDLRGGLTDPEGNAINFAHVKRVVISILEPDGTKSLRVGPQNVTNAAQLWFGGTGATAYETVKTFLYKDEPFTGWATTAGSADLLPVFNPSLTDAVTYGIWVLGTST
ncbi:hypothetical protein VT84_13635 [Gemmata sp. SH-PL17]|uniref:hypothetical protein n=1 Tax=Gemmata sp. SH-PL17 TaxID=1630693 RepID=UPI00078B92C6|nr:hypothetical protein [Gemmata sp. SH-PL17]AMV25438.1 hypothetical protein VT84_13635 [Gemmata sp. SH-PL17]